MNTAATHLEGVLAAIEGRAVNVDTGEVRPLVWDGVRWCRQERAEERAVDVFGEPLPAQPIAPGWVVESMTQAWAGEWGPLPRMGVVVDVAPDENGELVYECVETSAKRNVYRLEVARSDVYQAQPSAQLRRYRDDVHLALGGQRGWRLRCDRGWAVEVWALLERLIGGGAR